MPIDEDGNRADVVMDAASTISRMNLGRLHEHYLSAAARDVTKRVKAMLGITSEEVTIPHMERLPSSITEQAYMYLLGFYEIVSEQQYNFQVKLSLEERLEHLTDVCNDGVYLYCPIDNPRDSVEVVKAVERSYRPTYGPVTFVGDSGERRVSKKNIRIAPLYLMLLEKIADDWSSVSSGKLQHFGILSPQTKSEKFSYPYRNTPIRTIGETEGRIFAGYCGREAIAEMMDRSNSPVTQRNAIWNILSADKPSNIDHLVDRNYIPLGGAKPQALVKHILGTAGTKFVYEPETPQNFNI